jgi:predicted CXXCH cytochrome family protein
MARRRGFIGLVAMVTIVLLALAGRSLFADALEEEDTAGRVPYPSIARGQGEKCVADTDFMRRNHMTMLKHQRDETMLKGVRTKQYSLKECVSCHAVDGPDATPVTVSSPKHFCRSCHDYVAVKIDCFECHASRPEFSVAVVGGGKE